MCSIHFDSLDTTAEDTTAMKDASMFWQEVMSEYRWNRQNSLPLDRQRNFEARRTDRAFTSRFIFHAILAETLVNHARAMHVSLAHIFLTSYFVFLFKMVTTESDLCVGMNVDNRLLLKLTNAIGNFTNL